MPREKKTGTCSVCEQEKPLFDVKNKICGSCAGKKGGGRPVFVKKEPVIPMKASQVINSDIPEKPDSGVQYLCDACNKPQYYGQRKCRCGMFNDWRSTPVEQDPDIVICPDCGAVCGHADQEIPSCARCNGGQ